MKQNKLIGLTYGDPRSIGPEILIKTLRNWKFTFRPLVIGLKDYLPKNQINSFHKKDLKKTNVEPGQHSYNCLKSAVKLAKKKKISALVTGPVSKEAINSAFPEIKFSGQTEEIAKLCNLDPKNVIMLFVANDLRIALFTRHIPIKAVSSKLKTQKLKEFIFLLDKEIKKWFHIRNPKIAILGLNPHASEKGMFGNEEENVIIPLIKNLLKKGLKLYGPLSPDGALGKAGQDYLAHKKQNYDVYVSFYHDQCLPMFKAVCGFKGVNVTLGLPFLRVSVDHGTAFDIAGKNKASNEGLVSAIKLVEKLLFSDKR